MNNYDLNKLFSHIDRRSNACDEGKYFEILRNSPAVTVISGGQSGVDSAGLNAASFLGLPAFAIMPTNGRREGEPIEDYARRNNMNLRKIELSSDSYKYRTYANVYFADVTLIFDFVGGSEGTDCTIQASEFLGRPCLLIQDIENSETNKLVRDFLMKTSPNVINISGNSLSKITKSIENKLISFLKKILRGYCFLKTQSNIDLSPCVNYDKIKVAIPNFSVCREIFKDFFQKAFNIELQFSKKLVLDYKNITLILARPREILNLKSKGIDVSFVGQDLCEEYDYKEEILLKTGLIPNATVLVSKKLRLTQEDRICSQYPVFAKKLLNRNIEPITGSAEAYIGMNIYDACVDTYQTGNTVEKNNLKVVKKLYESSLVMLGDERIKNTYFYNQFINYLRGEL